MYAREAVRKQWQVETLVSTPVNYTCTNVAEHVENRSSGVPDQVRVGVYLVSGVEQGPTVKAGREGFGEACESSIGMGCV